MKLQQLHFFVAVYEEGSFSAGALRVNATQSGLSMHVRQLENRHGVTLLSRSSTGVTPTQAGRVFYHQAVKVLHAASQAEEVLRDLSGSLSDHIHVGLMPTFTGSVLGPAMMRFKREYPNVRVSIDEAYSATLSNRVSEGLLDFAVVPAVDTDLGLETSLMAEDRECLVRAGAAAAEMSPTATLSELGPMKLVLPTRVNARRPRIERYIEVNRIEVTEVMELDAMLGTLEIVANSEWMSILPSVLGLADRDGKKRRFMPLVSPGLTVEYMRISNRSKPMGRAARSFADVLQEELNTALED